MGSGVKRQANGSKIIECPNGMLRVRLRLNSLEDIAGWVMRFGTHATVIAPEQLRNQVLRAPQEISRKYSGPLLLAGPDEG